MSKPARTRRRYDGTLRRKLAAGTRERIVAAGSTLLHRSPIRDWRALTIRAVAERAGVNERTVYRHFANERGLHDAVMHRLEEEAGIHLARLRLEDVADAAARIFEHVSSYPREPRPPLDPTLTEPLRHEGVAREMVNRIQRLRKEAGYLYTDRIALWIQGAGAVADAVRTHADFIQGETLARSLTIGSRGIVSK